jgi:hypothetical protein
VGVLVLTVGLLVYGLAEDPRLAAICSPMRLAVVLLQILPSIHVSLESLKMICIVSSKDCSRVFI